MIRLLGEEQNKVNKKIDAVMDPLVKRLMANDYSGNEVLGCIVRSASLFVSLAKLRKAEKLIERVKQ